MQKSSTYNEPSVFGSKQFTMLFILILNRVVESMIQLVPAYGDPQGNFL